MDLKRRYQENTDNLRQRAAELKQALDDEKHRKTTLQESLRILNAFADTMMLTREHIEQFVELIEVYRNGSIHVVFYSRY